MHKTALWEFFLTASKIRAMGNRAMENRVSRGMTVQNPMHCNTNFNFEAVDLLWGSMKEKNLFWHFGNRFVLEAILQILWMFLFLFWFQQLLRATLATNVHATQNFWLQQQFTPILYRDIRFGARLLGQILFSWQWENKSFTRSLKTCLLQTRK